MIPAAFASLFTGDEYPLWLYVGFIVVCLVLYALTGMFDWVVSCFKRS